MNSKIYYVIKMEVNTYEEHHRRRAYPKAY